MVILGGAAKGWRIANICHVTVQSTTDLSRRLCSIGVFLFGPGICPIGPSVPVVVMLLLWGLAGVHKLPFWQVLEQHQRRHPIGE